MIRGCELALVQPRKVGNMDCTFCMDCVRACPHDALIRMEHISKSYGRVQALEDVTFTVGERVVAWFTLDDAMVLER